MGTRVYPPSNRAFRAKVSICLGLTALCCAESNPDVPDNTCTGPSAVVTQRIVRLSEQQLVNSYTSLFAADAAAVILRGEDLSRAAHQFPPLGGDVGVSDALLDKYDRLAQAAMSYVSRNVGALTPCGATPTDKRCVQQYLLSFAERAFRHPLTIEEQSALTGRLWSDLASAGATLAEALGYGVHAVLSSPSFVYRTEFGSDPGAEGLLAPYELASALSLFLTDAPPDAELLAAAASNRLATRDDVRAQAARLLATPGARSNLERAMIQYFSLSNAPTVVLNPEATPGLTVSAGLQSSIFHEGELFLRNRLWSGALDELLTSRQTWTNAAVATQIYGIPAPDAVDADGFGLVELPPDRSGLLTLSTFLFAGARSTGGSPVSRGLAVNRAIVCEVNPPFPSDPGVGTAIAALAGESELEKAEYRSENASCAGCHARFDAFGMVLEPYDAVGRLRNADPQGRPIDAAWTTTTLPESVGGATVASAADAGRELAGSGALDRCLAMNFINYALAEISRGGANNLDPSRGSQTASCAVQSVIDQFDTTDRSFASLMREIAASDALMLRSTGQ
jgi:hypothetical protein